MNGAVDAPPACIARALAVAAASVVVALSVAADARVAGVTRTNTRVVELSAV